MGISGLLRHLKQSIRRVNGADLKGRRVGIDAYVWLHRGVFTCAAELAQGIRTEKHIAHFMRQLDSVARLGLIPVVVFDGRELPGKAQTELDRKRKRDENREAALLHMKENRKDEAYACFAKSVDVTPVMAFQVIQVLRKRNIEFIVSPYEADAQLAYLCSEGIIDLALTEDSDLIPHGCPMVLFKFSADGSGDLYVRDKVITEKGSVFVGWDMERILDACILAGCDYVASLSGLGIKKACTYITTYGTIEKAVEGIRNRRLHTIPDEYAAQAIQARLTFLHHIVYDPRKRCLVNKQPLPDDSDMQDFGFLGEMWSEEISQGVCEGNMDPTSFDLFDTSSPLVDSHLLASTEKGGRKRAPTPSTEKANKISSYFPSGSKSVKLLPDEPTPKKQHKLELVELEETKNDMSEGGTSPIEINAHATGQIDQVDKAFGSEENFPNQRRTRVVVVSKYFINQRDNDPVDKLLRLFANRICTTKETKGDVVPETLILSAEMNTTTLLEGQKSADEEQTKNEEYLCGSSDQPSADADASDEDEEQSPMAVARTSLSTTAFDFNSFRSRSTHVPVAAGKNSFLEQTRKLPALASVRAKPSDSEAGTIEYEAVQKGQSPDE